MLKRLKDMLSFAPAVELVDFEDGLLAVRSDKKLTTDTSAVKLKTSRGTVVAQVSLESYDLEHQVYRFTLFDQETILESLECDRREHVRLPKAVRVTSPAFPGYSGITEDISVSGARVNVSSPLETDVEIELKMELDDPDIPPLHLYADVCWTGVKPDGSYHSGLRFQAQTESNRRTIERYIANRLRMEKKLHTLEEVEPEV